LTIDRFYDNDSNQIKNKAWINRERILTCTGLRVALYAEKEVNMLFLSSDMFCFIYQQINRENQRKFALEF